jgi:hypothetical protein
MENDRGEKWVIGNLKSEILNISDVYDDNSLF